MPAETLTIERPSQETAKKVFGTLVVTLSFIYDSPESDNKFTT